MRLIVLAYVSVYAICGFAQTRPPVTGIATFAVKVGDMDEARKYYSGILGYDEIFVSKATGGTVFKVNDHQYVELSATLKGDEDRLSFIGLETTDARKLAAYLASKGLDAPANLAPDGDGNLSFTVKDPMGHAVRFVQYMPGSAHSRLFGQHLSPRRTSDHIIHVGVWVPDQATADKFYVGILNCKLLWEGGPATNPHSWVSVLMPEGTDWIEYMASTPTPNVRQLGGNHHMALGVPEIQTPFRTVTERGYKGQKPILARDGRWLLNLYDSSFTRSEFMVRWPVVTPCCTPLHDPTFHRPARATDLYFIDVATGSAVLVVTPDKKAVLLGAAPQDRLEPVMKEAGVEEAATAKDKSSLDGVDFTCGALKFGKFRFADRTQSCATGAADLTFAAHMEGSKSRATIVASSAEAHPDLWRVNNDNAGRWIHVVAAEDGTFDVTNVGDGLTKHYSAR